ncbi:MAG: hypothetical protein HY000_02600 [Planctomycetes bacterium]|nr:hypothetical protein [Planctomycetota bacterium]
MPILLANAIPEKDWKDASPSNGYLPFVTSGGGTIEDQGTWRSAIDQIAAMQNLGDDWDGLGATAPSREVLECAIGLAHLFQQRNVEPPSCVVPSTAGTVVLIWHFKDGSYSDVEIDRPFHADVTWIEPGKPAEYWELPNA